MTSSYGRRHEEKFLQRLSIISLVLSVSLQGTCRRDALLNLRAHCSFELSSHLRNIADLATVFTSSVLA